MIIAELQSQSSGAAALHVTHGASARLRGNNSSMTLTCETGSFWVTVEGDSRDYHLKMGEGLEINSRKLVVAQALESGVITVTESGNRDKPRIESNTHMHFVSKVA